MNSSLRKQLSVIILTTLVGVVTGWLLMSYTRDCAASLDVDLFSALMFVIPCAIMLIGSFIVAFTATEIGRQLYVVSVVICLVTGLAATVLASAWMSDAAIAAQLLANSPDDAVVRPILNSPITMIRNVAAFVLVPTVGNVIGAWLGSRFHPMTAEKAPKGGKKKKK